MTSDPYRIILGFYSSEQVDAEKAYRAISTSRDVRVRLFVGNGTKPKSPAEVHYAPLRLEGESLIVAETSSSNIQAVVKQLQSVGLPAVFVLREDFADLTSAHKRSLAPSGWCPPTGKPEEPATHGSGRFMSERFRRPILVRLRECEIELDAARRDLLEATRLGHSTTAAADWLLDNAYLIRTQIAETRRHLPRNYRKLFSSPHARHTSPNVNDLAEQLVRRRSCSE